MVNTQYTTDLIGISESTLHRDLKSYYAYCHRGSIEQKVCGYKIDVLSGRQAYEIQTKGFHKIRPKISRLVGEGYSVTVVYPLQGMLESRQALGRTRKVTRNTSPIRAFEELVYIAKMLPLDKLSVEVLRLHERSTKRKNRRNRVRNTRLVGVLGRWLIESPSDLIPLLPGDLPSPFTTKDLADSGKVGKMLANKVAYTLRHSGAATQVGHRGRYILYELVNPS
jgi:hypothetical protein